LSNLETKLHDGMGNRRHDAVTNLAESASKLAALSPLAVLDRGYSLVVRTEDGKLVSSASEIRSGDDLRLRFRTGTALATVVSTEAQEEAN
jgi:exodeoxyribonuclease VII large subunit